MKNLTIKKVALGLFLAGYAASSAFATQVETTVNTIIGNKPVLQSRAGQDHELTVDIIHANGTPFTGGTVRVGDKIHIKYRLADLDGDTDTATAEKVKYSLKIYGKTSSGPWTVLTTQPTVTSNYDSNDQELGELVFEINSDFVGKDKIGFKIKAETEFGVPTEGEWLAVGDIFGSGTPNHGDIDPTDPGNAGGPGDGNSSNGGIGTIPGPIMPSSGQLGIFLIDSTGVITNNESYTKSGTALTPRYGERYAAVIWDDSDGNKKIDSGETEYTSNFTFVWNVTGAGVPGNGGSQPGSNADLTGDGNRSGTNDTIFLGSKNNTAKHNSLYSGYSVAGIQGYQLQVKTN